MGRSPCPQVWRRSNFRRFPRQSAQTRTRRTRPQSPVWEEAGKVLGPASYQSTQRYSHLANDTLLAAVEAAAAKQKVA